MKVLVTDGLDAGAVTALRAAGHDVTEARGLAGESLAVALSGVHALIVRGATRVTAEAIANASELAIVVRAGSGVDNIDLVAAEQRGVRVANTPAANAVSVAELVFALLLGLERRLVEAVDSLRQGRWERSKLEGREIAGRRLSLLGFGRIGREVALRARAFGLSVRACDPPLVHWPAGFEWVQRSTLDQALAEADVLSLHLPLQPNTRGLIGAPELARLPDQAVLVNVARGGLVDEAALESALRSGRLRGAALDVFASEPPGASPLLAFPNVIATPHLGASTREAQQRAGAEAAAIVIAALAAPSK